MPPSSSRVLPVLLASASACGAVDESSATSASFDLDAPDALRGFTETYDCGTRDIGSWALSANDLRPRVIEAQGGNPGGYLYSEVASPVPTWSTASSRVLQDRGGGAGDSVFVGNYRARGVRRISADLCVYQAGSWSSSRTVTLLMTRWDVVNDTVALEATYSLPDIPELPEGWQRYRFDVDARSSTIPAGWSLQRGDGTPASDAEWAILMEQVDVLGFGYWKPGYMYPALGLWELGIDNIHIGAR